MNQIIAMNQDGDGAWQYTDPADNDMVWELEQISGMNLSAYDVLLNDAPQWAGNEPKRQMLAGLRLELSHHFKRHFADTDRLELQVKSYHQAFDLVLEKIKGMVLALKDVRRKTQPRAASKMPRPNAISKFRQAIKAAMSPYKRDFQTFKAFMHSWETDPIDGLTINTFDHKESFVVTDEDGDLGEKVYTWGTLQKMYAEI